MGVRKKGLVNERDVLYVESELDYFTAKYYLRTDNVYIYGKNYETIADYVGKVVIPENSIRSFLPTYPEKAFIYNKSGTYDIQALY